MKATKAPEWCACGLEPVDAPSKLGRLCRLQRAARLRQEAAGDLAARGYQATAADLDDVVGQIVDAGPVSPPEPRDTFQPAPSLTVAELAAAQGITGPQDLESLRAPEPETEEDRAAVDAFVAALTPAERWAEAEANDTLSGGALLLGGKQVWPQIADDPEPAPPADEGEAGDRGTDGPPVATIECPTCHQTFPTREACTGHQRWCGKPRRKQDFSDPDPDWPKCEV